MNKLIILLSIVLVQLSMQAVGQNKIEHLLKVGELDKAVDVLTKKMEAQKAGAEDYFLLGTIYEQKFDYSKALSAYTTACELDSTTAYYFEKKADACLDMGKKKDALRCYHTANSLKLSDRLLGKIAGVQMDLTNYQEAEALFETLYTADSSNVYFMRRLMQARYKLKQYGYVVGLASSPYFPEENTDMLMLLADCFYKLNDNINAILVLNQIMAIDSLYKPALSKLGYIHFNNRNYPSAQKTYLKLNEVEGFTDPFHLKNYAICNYFTGDQQYAAATLDSLTEVIEDDVFVPFYAGLAYKKLGEIDQSFKFLKKASNMAIPQYAADVYHHLGRTYALKREFEKAIETYKYVRQLDSTNYQVLYDIAVTFEEWNLNRTMAIVYYQQFVLECTNKRNTDLKYAEDRIKWIKEELFFEGE